MGHDQPRPDARQARTRPQHGPYTITTIAESPKKAGLLYAGTDDGRLHVSRSGGEEWTDLSDKIPDVPKDRWITRIECSHFDEGTAYVTIDRHRNDDLKPYIFKTTDYGATWKPLANNLPPEAPVHVIRESSKNKDLLFAGTENGLFISQDGGKKWQHFTNGLPPAVIVRMTSSFIRANADRELVIGTHARSVYVMDIAPLEEMTDKVMADAMLTCLTSSRRFRSWSSRNDTPRLCNRPAFGRHYTRLNPVPKRDDLLPVEQGHSSAADTDHHRSRQEGRGRWPLR